MRVEGVREHQLALQRIADANGGDRFSGFPGYDASVDYVVETLEAAGYDPEVQEFDYLAFEVVGPSTLQQVAPNAITYREGIDFGAITQTDPGDVTAPVQAVDLALGLGNASTSGCEASDFAGFTRGNIALLQRGTCTFELKAENAAAAGAVGIVIFNQGNTAAEDRNNIPAVTLTANNTSGIPVLGTTYALGVTLANTPGLRMRVFANTLRQVLPTYNVLAEKTGKNDNNVVMAGAHLDSVLDGPGINDNGSGSAAILEAAEQLANFKPQNTIRFAWWGAEESGLVGSTNYVNGLSQAEKDRIALYLNFDMIGSPNYIQMVYDSDESGFEAPVPVPPGSIAIEDLFESFYTLRSEPYDDAEFSGRSDYQAFINNGIPAGGLFTGAEVRRERVDAGLAAVAGDDDRAGRPAQGGGPQGGVDMRWVTRLDAAYQLNDKQVIRGGYGLFYGAFENRGGNPSLGYNYPFQFTLIYRSPNDTAPNRLGDGSLVGLDARGRRRSVGLRRAGRLGDLPQPGPGKAAPDPAPSLPWCSRRHRDSGRPPPPRAAA